VHKKLELLNYQCTTTSTLKSIAQYRADVKFFLLVEYLGLMVK